MRHFKENRIGFINIIVSHIGSKKSRNMVDINMRNMNIHKKYFEKYNIPPIPNPDVAKQKLPTVVKNKIVHGFLRLVLKQYVLEKNVRAEIEQIHLRVSNEFY